MVTIVQKSVQINSKEKYKVSIQDEDYVIVRFMNQNNRKHVRNVINVYIKRR